MPEVNYEKLMNHLIGQVIKKLKEDPKNKDRCIEPSLIRKILDELILDGMQKEQEKEQNKNSYNHGLTNNTPEVESST